MAEKPGEMTGATHSGKADGADHDAARLQRDIAQTRASMAQTLDAIQDRITPRNVVNRTMASVRETTMSRIRDWGNSASSTAAYVADRSHSPRERLMRAARQNPRAVAMVGVAAAWVAVLALRGRRSKSAAAPAVRVPRRPGRY